jgi:hypothetical protein
VPFSDFRFPDVKEQLGLRTLERIDAFGDAASVEPSPWLMETLRAGVPLATAIGTEKARSEFAIAPVMLELKRALVPEMSIFSGVELVGDPARGLSGVCDFVISRSPEQLALTAPAVVIVEAKNESLSGGMGQCMAAMVAARLFNRAHGHEGDALVLGAVTTGSAWKFMIVDGAGNVTLDLTEYPVPAQIARVLGLLSGFLRGSYPAHEPGA